MKSKKMVLRRISMVLCAVFAFMMLSGFTYSPEKDEYLNAYIEFANSAANINITQHRPDWFGSAITIDGVTGYATPYNWSNQALLKIVPDDFVGVNKIKVTVKWYDAAATAMNAIRFVTPNVNGSKHWSDYITPTGSNTWKTSEVIMENVDLTKKSILYGAQSADINMMVEILDTNGKNNQIIVGSSSYYGVLIHSVKVEPVVPTKTYKIADLNVVEDTALYSVNEDNVSLANTTAWGDASGFLGGADTTAIRTVTDANGVTLSGIPSGNIKHSDRKIHMIFDKNKFMDMKNANLEIVWFDNLDTKNIKKRITVNYASTDVNQWGSFVGQHTTSWQSLSGTWKTTTIPLVNCDFSNLRKVSKWFDANVQFDIANDVTDFGTPDDTSDDYAGLLINSIKLVPLPEYSFSGLKFTDEDGNTLKALNAGEKFYTDLSVTKTGGEFAVDVTVFVALYSADGKLEKISHLTKEVEPNTTEVFTNCFINPSDVSGKYVKVLVWDTVDGMIPIANALICE